MPKPFLKLRAALIEHDITQSRLARELLISPRWVSIKMCGHTPWTQEEMYIMMDLLEWPYDRMHDLFPRNGGAKASSTGRAGKLQAQRCVRA